MNNLLIDIRATFTAFENVILFKLSYINRIRPTTPCTTNLNRLRDGLLRLLSYNPSTYHHFSVYVLSGNFTWGLHILLTNLTKITGSVWHPITTYLKGFKYLPTRCLVVLLIFVIFVPSFIYPFYTFP